MFLKRAVVACVAALVLGGCGGEEAVEQVPPPPDGFDTSAQVWPPSCNSVSPSWVWRFYDPNGLEVGRHECTCGVLMRYGKQTNRTEYTVLAECAR
ncbi:hypothetical protein [Pyxidicoccus xibeiensis]|uniref:hypothetical protein n=1 Tax=Pyxidicoccus xibeiensis TaxID=2906759 RepID=UPI0020A81A75|nr:hypothetical protein [Pyxidicoccus xibeiensis]MCP3145229.1 hypothetical protein [Pyxidicoccus xibeiensis]